MSFEPVGAAAPEGSAAAIAGAGPAPEAGALKVLIVVGHPRRQSLCQALAAAYGAGAQRAGATVLELRLAELSFDPHVRSFDPRVQPVEESIAQARALLAWADHIVFVYPTWWGTMPALLKGFLDRVLAPGFAFTENQRGYVPLLGGKSAELLTTMDTPRWVYRWIYGAPGHKAMARATLGFCGFDRSFRRALLVSNTRSVHSLRGLLSGPLLIGSPSFCCGRSRFRCSETFLGSGRLGNRSRCPLFFGLARGGGLRGLLARLAIHRFGKRLCRRTLFGERRLAFLVAAGYDNVVDWWSDFLRVLQQ